MDTCRLTQEQVAALAGTTVRTQYQSPGEYGYVATLDIEITPPPDGVGDPQDGARRRRDGNLRDAFGRDDQGEKPC